MNVEYAPRQTDPAIRFLAAMFSRKFIIQHLNAIQGASKKIETRHKTKEQIIRENISYFSMEYDQETRPSANYEDDYEDFYQEPLAKRMAYERWKLEMDPAEYKIRMFSDMADKVRLKNHGK